MLIGVEALAGNERKISLPAIALGKNLCAKEVIGR